MINSHDQNPDMGARPITDPAALDRPAGSVFPRSFIDRDGQGNLVIGGEAGKELQGRLDNLQYIPAMATGIPDVEIAHPVPVPTGRAPGVDQNLPDVGQTQQQIDREKVGERVSESSQTIQSADSRQALADQAVAKDKEKSAQDELAKAEAAALKAQYDLDTANAGLDSQALAAKSLALNRAAADVRDAQARYEAQAAEYASQPPQTFWGSKSMAQKMAAAEAISLGSIGQALTGSGDNVGLLLIDRQLKEFDNSLQRRHEAEERHLSSLKTGISSVKDASDIEISALEARMLAARARLSQTYGQAILTAKTDKVKATAMHNKAVLDGQMAEIRRKSAERYEREAKSKVTKYEMENIVNPNGKPLTAEQSRSYVLYQNAKGNLDQVKGFNPAEPANAMALQKYFRSEGFQSSISELPLVGKFKEAVAYQALMKPLDELQRTNPQAAAYVRAAVGAMMPLLYKTTGAAVSKDELLRKMQETLGDHASSPAAFAQAQTNLYGQVRTLGESVYK